MASNSTISTVLVGQPFNEDAWKFSGIIPARNGKLYLVPQNANKVVSFNPQTNEWNEIGDDLGHGWKWYGGSLAPNGKIYCNPYGLNDNILVIDPSTETINLIPLPVEALHDSQYKYRSSSPDQNGNVWFFPHNASKIMKLNISTSTISTLNIYCGKDWKHATLSSNGRIYVVRHHYNARDNFIMEFDPIYETFFAIYHSSFKEYNSYSGLTEHKDGCLYGISREGVIKISVNTDEVTFLDHQLVNGNWLSWGVSIVGRDGCVYAPSENNGLIARYDPFKETTITTTKTGFDGTGSAWSGMSLGIDGHGYCAPRSPTQILKIPISWGHWLYLKHRLLIHESRATTHEEDHDGLETVRQFIIGANDDEFSYVMGFV